MKSIILTAMVGSALFTGGNALFSVSEPLALILIGASLIGLARFGKSKISKNKEILAKQRNDKVG